MSTQHKKERIHSRYYSALECYLNLTFEKCSESMIFIKESYIKLQIKYSFLLTHSAHMYIHVYIMLSALQVTNTLNDYGFTTEQARGITVIFDEYHSTLVTKTDLTNAIDKLSQRIEQVAAQVVQLEKNNNIRFEAMEKSSTARFEAMEKSSTARFEAMEKSSTARFEQVQENMAVRFEAMNDRFKAIDKQLGTLRWFLVASMAFMGTLMTINISLLAISIF